MKNQVAVVSLDRRFKKLEADLTRVAAKAFGFFNQNNLSAEIYLVNSSRMRIINRRYRGKDEPTDVLAFGYPKDFPQVGSRTRLVGEIYLCPPHIRRQGENINQLLVHGLLHLLGFNHGTKSDRMKMEKLEHKMRRWLNH